MDELFGAVYGLRSANLNTTPYETLKAISLQQISKPALRLGIVRVYDHFYERILNENEVDLSVNSDLMRLYYLQHFRGLEFRRSATPIDCDAVIADAWFRNMVEYRLAVLRANQLDSCSATMEEIHQLGPASRRN